MGSFMLACNISTEIIKCKTKISWSLSMMINEFKLLRKLIVTSDSNWKKIMELTIINILFRLHSSSLFIFSYHDIREFMFNRKFQRKILTHSNCDHKNSLNFVFFFCFPRLRIFFAASKTFQWFRFFMLWNFIDRQTPHISCIHVWICW